MNMSFDLRARIGKSVQSRVYFSPDVAEKFRTLCRHAKKSPDEMAEELIRFYVLANAKVLKLDVVELTPKKKKKGTSQ
jgi:hypothetical protein